MELIEGGKTTRAAEKRALRKANRIAERKDKRRRAITAKRLAKAVEKIEEIPIVVLVRSADQEIFIDYGDGSCFPPNIAGREVARRALASALAMIESSAMDELAAWEGLPETINESIPDRPLRVPLRLVR